MLKLTEEAKERKAGQLEKLTKKFQAFINYGATFEDSTNNQLNDAHDIAQSVLDGTKIQLIPPNYPAIVLSAQAARMLKPAVKSLIQLTLPQSKEVIVVFRCKDDLLGQLAQLETDNQDEIQPFLGGITISFDNYNIPGFNKSTKLHTFDTPPTLTSKQANAIIECSEKLKENRNNYMLLSDVIHLDYNMPMNILNVLGENVLNLSTLNLLELILVYATNSSAVYRNAKDEIKTFKIPTSFFADDEYKLNQSVDDIKRNLEELLNVGLVDDYACEDDNFVIYSHMIVKNIKQYSYTQYLGFYKALELKQQDYVYTFVNYLNWIRNLNYFKKDDETGKYITYRADRLTISLTNLIYNLDLIKYKNDHTVIAKCLTNCLLTGIKSNLLKYSGIDEIGAGMIKTMLQHPDRLQEIFILNPHE